MYQEILGAIGAIIAGLSGIYYILTILKGQTRPHRVTWFGWSLAAVLGAWSAIVGGAGAGAWVAVTFAVTLSATFILSLVPKYGKPGGERGDWLVGIIAAIGIVLWQVADLPAWSAATLAVAADLWFAWLTLRESWRQPETEALGPWVAGTVACALGVVSLETYNYTAVLYPVYILVANCAIVGVLIIRKPKKEHAK